MGGSVGRGLEALTLRLIAERANTEPPLTMNFSWKLKTKDLYRCPLKTFVMHSCESFFLILDIRAHADPSLGMINEMKDITKMIKNLQIEMADQVHSFASYVLFVAMFIDMKVRFTVVSRLAFFECHEFQSVTCPNKWLNESPAPSNRIPLLHR